MRNTIAIVLVSHSEQLSLGLLDILKQMTDDRVAVACCGGDGKGGLGTRVSDIHAAIDSVWCSEGVLVLVDLGGSEMKTELAITELVPHKRSCVQIAAAPLVEGAIMAAAAALEGCDLATALRRAEQVTFG